MKTILLAVLFASTTPVMSRPVLDERWSFYANGKPADHRHFYNGQEQGMQQAWTEDGQLYVNYEMRNGRRYGFINARPCSPVKEQP